MRRGSGVALGLVMTAATIGCFATDKKLPKIPEASQAPPGQVPSWWAAGSSACPSLTVTHTRMGPPGSNIRAGQIVGAPHPRGNRVMCVANGVPHGFETTFHPSGQAASHGRHSNGVRDGAWTTWHPSGQVASSGYYRQGVQVGMWEYWDSHGRPTQRGQLLDGKRDGMWVFWSGDAVGGKHPSSWKRYKRGREINGGHMRDGKPQRSRPVCIVGMAPPDCRLILVGDLTIRGTLEDQVGGNRASGHFDPGVVVNLAGNSAVGFSAALNFNDEESLYSYRVRYRHWLDYWIGVDVGYGVSTLRNRVNGTDGRLVFAGVTLADLVGGIAEVHWYDGPDGRKEYTVHLGVRIGAPVLLTAAYILAHIKK